MYFVSIVYDNKCSFQIKISHDYDQVNTSKNYLVQ